MRDDARHTLVAAPHITLCSRKIALSAEVLELGWSQERSVTSIGGVTFYSNVPPEQTRRMFNQQQMKYGKEDQY